MSPFVRGRIFPETESTGRAKGTLDALIWVPALSPAGITALDAIEILKAYLASISPSPCFIDFWVPSCFGETAKILSACGVKFRSTEKVTATAKVRKELKEGAPNELLEVAATALSINADVVLVSNADWYPYAMEFDSLNTLIANYDVLKTQCELFVRGHDVPWSFSYMVWNSPWTSFYQLNEYRTFEVGTNFLSHCQNKGVDIETLDAIRMLVHNRLPDLCYTRDRLLFYEMQQAAARRSGWERQEFLFEAGYYLNYYYMLLYGGFDHLALVVNGVLSLGLSAKNVGATYASFLGALAIRAPEIYSIFTQSRLTEFVERIGALRHFAAHRGSIMPGKIYEKLDPEPTEAELDAEISRQGLDSILKIIRPGVVQDIFRATLRHKMRLSMSRLMAEGIVFLKIKGFIYLTPSRK